ncbi:hypothetical protein D3C77_701420 [compost metagenome]
MPSDRSVISKKRSSADMLTKSCSSCSAADRGAGGLPVLNRSILRCVSSSVSANEALDALDRPCFANEALRPRVDNSTLLMAVPILPVD